jgi:hypothetical protein
MNWVRNHSSKPAFDIDSHAVLAFMLMTGPVAWLLSLFLKFILASRACLRPSEFSSGISQQSLVIIIDIVAIAVICVAAWFAYRKAHDTAALSWENFHHVTHVGEARKHFLALWALLISALFIVAILFGLVADVTVSPCTL